MFGDSFGLCPNGTHEATPDEISKIIAAANQIVGQKMSYANIKCNQFVNKAINQAFPGTTSQAYTTSAIGAGQGPFEQTSSPGQGELALLNRPGHVVLITGVSNGQVSSFVGSQSSTGPKPVGLPDPGNYWANNLSKPGNVSYYKICLPN